jgi:hypothetical protein
MTDYTQDLNALDASITLIKYSNKELLEMLNKLSKKYENKKDFEDFIGFNKVDNIYHHQEEDIFNYIRRHTLGRPRDFVEICRELSYVREEISVEQYRTNVNNKSARIIDSYFSEQNPFLNILDDLEQRKIFFSLINSNILNTEELMIACDIFNRKGCDKICKNCNYSHPFCELYNIGLLGVLKNDEINGKYIQSFFRPSDVRKNVDKSLPKSKLYILHPALEHIISDAKNDLNYDKPYTVVRNFIVGHKLEWDEIDIKKIETSKIMKKFNITNSDELELLIYEQLSFKKDNQNENVLQDFFIKIQEKMLTHTTNEIATNAIEMIKQIFI